MPWFLIILCTVCLGTGAAVSYYLLTMDKRLRKESEGWTETTATISGAAHRIQGGGRSPAVEYADLTYEYLAGGVAYSLERSFYVSSSEAKAIPNLAGRTIPLRYNPGDVTATAVFDDDVRKLCKSLRSRKR